MAASPDLEKLRALIFREKWQLIKTNIDLNVMRADVILHRAAEKLELSSTAPDFFMFVAKMRLLPDREGRIEFRQTNTTKYYDSIDHFIDDGGLKLKAAMKRVLARQAGITLPEALELLKRVAVQKRRLPTDIPHLNTHYYEILALLTLYSREILAKIKELEKRMPTAALLGTEIESALRSSLAPALARTPIEALGLFASWIDLEHTQQQVSTQAAYHNALFNMLISRGEIPGPEALAYIADICRRFQELTRSYFQALMKATWLRIGVEPLPSKGFEWEVAQLKTMGFSAILQGVDPKVRNSESHLETVIVHDKRAVHFNTDNGTAIYTYDDVQRMTDALRLKTVPALLISFQKVELWLYLNLVISSNFKLLIIGEMQNPRYGK